MRQAASDPFLLATDLADYLVKRGVPFRQAHEIIGKLTAYSLENERAFPDMTLEEYRQFSEVFDDSVFAMLNLENALQAREVVGAPSPARVGEELQRWASTLESSPESR
jgi:argininosuccinate lyase